jgi:hypothetical protein
MKMALGLLLTIILISCGSSKQTVRVTQKPGALQTFTPIVVDTVKIENKDFSEIEKAVNDTYAKGEAVYGDAQLSRQEGKYIYIHVFELRNENNCYRVTVDKRSTRIVNIQPNCPQ